MGALKTAENGKSKGRAEMPPQRVSDPRPGGRLFPVWARWLIGLTVGGVLTAVAICTAFVYGHRLETLQSRVEMLEEHCSNMEATMRQYVDERLRAALLQQVSQSVFYLIRFYALYPGYM